ncbi:MAG: hypothetical protein V4736_15770 [Bdellovibrionota bacterium]
MKFIYVWAEKKYMKHPDLHQAEKSAGNFVCQYEQLRINPNRYGRLGHTLIAVILAGTFTTSCVSVSLPGKEVVPAKLTLTPPASPFVEVELTGIQYAWQSPATGNIISVISNCAGNADPSLQTMETDAMGAFDKYDILETKEIMFNNRKARRTNISGEIDGIPVMMDMLVTKKNGCRITLNYSGRLTHFTNERTTFNQFVDSVKAP